jgi:tetratricopeptide (TPR) repeat protein
MPATQQATLLLDQAALLHQRGELARAEALCRQATAAAPQNFRAWYMLAGLCYLQGHGPEALAAADAALRLEPRSADTLNLKGAVQRVMGRPEEARASFAAALDIQPGNAGIWLNLSSVLGDLGRAQEALGCVEKALELRPDDAEAWNNRGAALRALGRPDEALESCTKALALRPDYIAALRNVGALLCETFRVEEGMRVYARQARLGHAAQPQDGDGLAHKQRHDAQQKDYLAGRNVQAGFHLEEGARLAGAAVNPRNAAAIAAQWAKNRPQIVVIDDLLSPEALEQLQRFCWGSTVWRKAYREGYLGATPESGFACPLLAQIADELRAVFPSVFEGHPLRYLWGFKYDSSLSGIDVHADFAAVNVNFWITPDAANLDPESGGLVLWDVAAPPDWNVVKYNRDAKANRAFLERERARPITIPYRANRAVIFDSDLFHKTDKISFKDGYLNRRINITMLYGDR